MGIPEDQGAFDWLDMFKAKHPNYTELSDRSLGSLLWLCWDGKTLVGAGELSKKI